MRRRDEEISSKQWQPKEVRNDYHLNSGRVKMCTTGYLEIIGLNDMGHRREKSERENWHKFPMSSGEEGIFV